MSDSKNVLAICLSPCFQKIMQFDCFHENEVNRCKDCDEVASGKGINVCRFLNHIGTPCTVLTHLGGARRFEFAKMLKDEGLPFLCTLSEEGGIRTCITIINDSRATSTELVQESFPVGLEENEAMLKRFSDAAGDFDAVVISGTKAPGYDKGLYAQMVKLAKEKGRLVVLDIKGDELKEALNHHPDVIKPNLAEFAMTFMQGREVLENEDSEGLFPEVEAVARGLFNEFGCKTVISRGKFDSWYFDGLDGAMHRVPNHSIKVVNTIGCGDSLTAGMVKSLIEGKSLGEALSNGMELARRKACSLLYDL